MAFLRVGISMLTLVPGEMGGSEGYARALCRALGDDAGIEAKAFVTAAGASAAGPLPAALVTELALGASSTAKLRGVSEGLLRRRALRRRFDGIDVVHYPFTVPLPPLDLPTVITLHDLQHLDLPELFTRQKRLFRRLAYDRAARRADIVIVGSAFVRDRAVALLGLDADRLMVIPHGVDHSTFTPADTPREPFILYPARPWPHKNHRRLFEAFGLLRQTHPDLRLVLTGGGTEALAGLTGVDARGAVPRDELVDLYRRASCVVFPSLYEGFGAPPVEAMACGTPVACSDRGSLSEVCGSAAVLFDALDPEAIAASVSEALERADELSRLGIARAAGFTWSLSAEGHIRAYAAAAAS